jgi:hypothetical protein
VTGLQRGLSFRWFSRFQAHFPLQFKFSRLQELQLYSSAFLFSLRQTVTKALKMAHVLDESASYHLPAGVVSVLDATIDFVYSFEPLVAKTVVLGTINYPS